MLCFDTSEFCDECEIKSQRFRTLPWSFFLAVDIKKGSAFFGLRTDFFGLFAEKKEEKGFFFSLIHN
jgi:hypothetical protein